MDKVAPTEYDVHDFIRRRWSPRAFDGRPVSSEALRSLFEAARWSASCANEQPWRFLVALRQNEGDHARLLACLDESNQKWAKHAPVLVLTMASTTFARTGQPNRHGLHDVGLATAQLLLQATAMGLACHPMAGYDVEKARATFAIPDDHELGAAIAIGHPGDPEALPEPYRTRETAPRVRKPQSEVVFAGRFGDPWRAGQGMTGEPS